MERLNSAPIGLAAGVAAAAGGVVVLYVFGIAGLMISLEKSVFEASALVAFFIPGDLIKAVIAGFVTAGLARARPQSVLSRS